ncbi:transporter substrate-binding domain-containing protein [Aeromonas hydrophila]|uniref:transporter substrate-binding domain-containing protein n=1 Tax=Aeromonas hydrophila TaxID=644 RepID=UPI0009574823|nr:transporter substrate-binding domain-containing protein [Aeromonas hydrophila]SIR20374.1 ABC-type amino acid transport substrate-binding protein [Aeromonas hydrophila]SIR37026.1 ABC-type amino acid transport substrate-binding protein [Aeromonas hydrophila]
MWRTVWLSVLISTWLSAAEQPIRAWGQMLDHPNPMVMKLLIRALDLTASEYGDYHFVRSSEMEQGRAIRALQSGGMDIAVFAPDLERERTLLPVPIPVDKGLLGWRVCMIMPDRQQNFLKIFSLNDWRESGLIIGQLNTWPDTEILRSNKLLVEETAIYENLFKMLSKGRFDCFLRSVIEVEDEFKKHPDFIIESHLLFYYPLPLLYFVTPSNPQLAQRIQIGLTRLIVLGEYDRIIEQEVTGVVKRLGLEQRRVIELKNYNLTPFLKGVIDKTEIIPTRKVID